MKTRTFRRLSRLALGLVLGLPATANTVTFSGFTWNSFYGPENLTVDGSGDLHVPTTSNTYGAAATTLAADTASLFGTYTDGGPGVEPGQEVWVLAVSGDQEFEAAVGAFGNFDNTVNVAYWYILTSGVMTSSNFVEFPRTAGDHTAGFNLLANGDLEFLYDGSVELTTTPADFAIPDLQTGLLTAGGTTEGQDGVFNSFTTGVPEPRAGALAGLGLVALLAAGWKRSERPS